MNRKVRLKLCPYCDGQMDFDVIACPYCGNEVSDTESDQIDEQGVDGSIRSLSAKETLTSLYPPPYQPKVYDDHFEEELHHSLPEDEESEVEEKGSTPLLPILLFSLGVNFLAFALMLFFFSTRGALFLKFNGHLWFVYLLIACPLLFFGFRKIKTLR